MQKMDLPPDEFDDEIVISDLDSGKKVTRISLVPRTPQFKIRVRPLEITVAVLLILILTIAVPRLQTASTQSSTNTTANGQLLQSGHVLFTYSDQHSYPNALSWSFDSQHLFFTTTNQDQSILTSTDPTIFSQYFAGPSTLTSHTYDTITGQVSTQQPQELPGDWYYPLNLTTFFPNRNAYYTTHYRYIFYAGMQNQIDTTNAKLYQTILMLDGITGKVTDVWHETADSQTPSSCSLSPSNDSRYIVFCGEDGILHIWDATVGQEVRSLSSLDHKKPSTLAWSPDNRQLVVSTSVGSIIMDATTGQALQSLPATEQIGFLWSPDQTRLLSIELDPSNSGVDIQGYIARLWDPFTGKRLATFTHFIGTPYWLPNGKDMLLISTKEVQAWDSQTGQIIARVAFNKELKGFPQLSPDGRLLALISSAGDAVHVWSTITGKEVRTFTTKKTGLIYQWRWMYWSPDSQYIATTYGDGTIQIWNARIGSPIYQYELPINRFRTNVSRRGSPFLDISLSWSPNGRMVAVQADTLLAVLQAP